MHELALAAELVTLAEDVARKQGACRVLVMRVKVGAASCLSPDSLAFGFEALSAGTCAEGCRLDFERPSAPVACPSCGWRGECADIGLLTCLRCGGSPLTILGGRELSVTSLDVE